MNELAKNDQDLIECMLSLMASSEEESDVTHKMQDIHAANSVKNFLDEMPGGFFIYHADGEEEVIYANAALLRIYCCETVEEFRALTGNSFKGMVHPDDLDAIEESIKNQIENDQYALDYVEYRIIRKDGEIRWIDDYGHFIHSETAGDIFYVFVGDATDKKRQQSEEKKNLLDQNKREVMKLQNQLVQYDREVEAMNQEQIRRLVMIEGLSIDYESIFYADLDQNTIQAYQISRRAEKPFQSGHEVREFKGFDSAYVRKWVHPEDRSHVLEATSLDYIRENLSKKKFYYVNYRILDQDRTKYLQLRIVNVGEEDHVSKIVLGYRNINEEVNYRMEQMKILEDALSQAKMANLAKDTFLTNMSHDIRTPMNAIVGLTSLAKKNIDNKEVLHRYLEQIETSSDQLLLLINDVLEISRMEAVTIYVEEEQCDLSKILQKMYEYMFPQAEKRDIALTIDTTKLDNCEIYSDQRKLYQILVHLVGNAVKYTEDGGHVRVTLTEREEALRDFAVYQFIVEDDGIGISESFLEHIFEPFERQRNTTLSGVHGTGLGLTIVKNTVDMMGGTIDVHSVAGEGSRFTVTLSLRIKKEKSPDVDETEDVIEELPVNPVGNLSEQKKILIAEDNEINLEIEAELMKDAGFLVDTAIDGSIAVEKVKNSMPGEYALIIMDIQMPVMNGYEAARAIRSLEDPVLAGIPIIALSANTFEEDRKMSMESGMNSHMEKPINTPKLLNLIEKILSSGQQGEKTS